MLQAPRFLVSRGTGFALFAALFLLYAQIARSQSAAPTASPEIEELQGRLSSAKAQLRDWANLNRYREANSKVPPPGKGETRVVFMGDSITDFWVTPRAHGFFPGKPYIDRGISGQTTPQMLVRFRADVLALQPKVVIILAGTNDLAGNTGPMTVEEIEGHLASMAQLARANGIKVVLASVLPVSSYGHRDDGTSWDATVDRSPQKIVALNAWIRKYSAENHYTYLNYFSAMTDEKGLLKKELSQDGLHPNAAGYDLMTPLAEAAIEAALKTK